MEIRYQRPVTYSIDLKPVDIKDLAQHLDMTTAKLRKLVNGGLLLDDHHDAVMDWINSNEDKAESDATAEIEDLEID